MRQIYGCLSLAIVLVCFPQTADAHRMSMGGSGHHHGGFGDCDFGFSDSTYFGFGGSSTEWQQERFEDLYDSIMEEYDAGLADTEDFYLSQDYTDILDDMQWLVDRYDLFLSDVEQSIDRLDSFIELTNDDLTFYNDLISEYELRDDLSEERLDRIVSRLTRTTDRLTTRLDSLTEQQTLFSDNLEYYTQFDSELQSYLEEITAAGGTATDDTTTAFSIPLRATVVPEPSSVLLMALLTTGLIAGTVANRTHRSRE